jgi:hypothetical protein
MPYLKNPIILASYQKYIQLMKSQTYSWSSSLSNSTFDWIFYSQIFPSLMKSSTIDGSDTLTYAILSSLKSNYDVIVDDLQQNRVFSLVMIGILGVLAVALRVRDNRKLLNLLKVVDSIPGERLGDRIR